MRVAVYSPLPPQRSGIADYTAELLPALARHAELELVTEPGQSLASELARWPRRPVAELARAIARGETDVVLYHLGN
ncbi:MAG TPA: glycosyl transferase family 1, partial [Thermoanaerobaculia bacterium]|nr:glycosyl transferase family 1 [Thermoanaerobaculia bacterium]